MKDKLGVIYAYILVVIIPVVTVMTIRNVKEYMYIKSKNLYVSEEHVYRMNVLPVNEDKKYVGEASWYDYEYPKGSGNWVTKKRLVAASRDYKRGSKLRVCSDKCVEVKVTDYGPELRTGRIIDMGSLAFSKICKLKLGVCSVSVEIIN